MKKLNCIAIDDEPHALKILEAYISKVPDLNLMDKFQSPLNALPILEKNEVDLIFLDIQMPELTGLQFLNVVKIKPAVILTTAYSEYALDSYDYDVADYLLKPYSFERFLKAVQKVKTVQPPVLKEIGPKPSSTIFIKGDAKHKFYQVEISDITYIEGLRNYLAVHLKEGKKVVTLQAMKVMEEQLPSDDFLRIHKSYLVNMSHVGMIEGNAVLVNGQRLPIGGSFRKTFFEWVEKRKG